METDPVWRGWFLLTSALHCFLIIRYLSASDGLVDSIGKRWIGSFSDFLSLTIWSRLFFAVGAIWREDLNSLH